MDASLEQLAAVHQADATLDITRRELDSARDAYLREPEAAPLVKYPDN